MDEITQAFHDLGVLLLLENPQGIHFGIDNTIWKVSEKFKGIKMIPHGTHYIHYTLESEQNMFKLGFFINISPQKRIHVRKWDNDSQDYINLPLEDEKRYIQGVQSYQFDSYLGPYPIERFQIWQECQNYISKEVLDELNPIEKQMYQIEQEYKQKDDIKVIAGTIYYSDIPKMRRFQQFRIMEKVIYNNNFK
ncbi:hypothetical protein IMG5_006470 [Ichthyophthirius multifiliis]|uniref:AAR2 N-terminal domain-containing protein n=1 Tax=Ichthyophthirius multifiliis TaxID=5932 RepID=G0QJM0_ICHMU|nr:hypothetical protein IMG5_006470 [Ichthyophthirius multifiliis]EGR34586.1 hypothetical protein IMG5_006470 [Ichthyophthirius multifiliis]|eukprot:XP_004039890.1 hypothetical protein IMG5_006470 [Ichthyophthirius multifiliis]